MEAGTACFTSNFEIGSVPRVVDFFFAKVNFLRKYKMQSLSQITINLEFI
jgi:hypothetical protein